MKVITLLSRKGGSGKTTLSVHLSVFAALKGRGVVLVDLDPQGSACTWYELRDIESEFITIPASAAELPRIIQQAKEGGADLVVIDTAPHSDKEAAAAVRLSDFALVPCRPELFDLKAIPASFDIIKLTNTKAAVVLNGCPRGRVGIEAHEALKAQGYPVLDLTISDRVAFKHAIREGRCVHEYEPDSVAANDITTLFDYLEKEVKI